MNAGRMCVLACAALAAVAMLAMPGRAETIDDFLGTWCNVDGGTRYVFSRSRLLVKFKDGKERELHIEDVQKHETWIEIVWKPPYTNTGFKFTDNDNLLIQIANSEGDMGPERHFRRC